MKTFDVSPTVVRRSVVSLKSAALLIFGLVLAHSAAMGGVVAFFDDFSGPPLSSSWQPSLPNANLSVPYWGTTHVATYVGAPNHAFQTFDGSSVLRISNTLHPLTRRGWRSTEVFNGPGFLYEVRFNTLNQSWATSIDAFIEIAIFDAADPSRYDIISPYGGEYSAWRVVGAGSSIDNAFTYSHFEYQNHTWYRLVLHGAPHQNIRASLCSDLGTELVGFNLGHTVEAFPYGFRIALSQAMGEPVGPHYGDVAVDFARVEIIPEPATGTLATCGLVGMLTLLRRALAAR